MFVENSRALWCLKREVKSIQSEKDEDRGWSGGPVTNDNLFLWEVVLFGPDVSLKEGFRIRITFDDKYPTIPPRIVFLDVPFHPNVLESGKICFDFGRWTPTIRISPLLSFIRSTIIDPQENPLPVNFQAACLMWTNRVAFNRRIQFEALRRYLLRLLRIVIIVRLLYFIHESSSFCIEKIMSKDTLILEFLPCIFHVEFPYNVMPPVTHLKSAYDFAMDRKRLQEQLNYKETLEALFYPLYNSSQGQASRT